MATAKGGYLPLFETKEAKGRVAYLVFALSTLVAICMILVYRVRHVPTGEGGQGGRWVWIGLFVAELWLSLAWLLRQSLRWNPVYRYTFKDRLSHRYERELPVVDIFVCTADPKVEPPIMVINTVLSVMAYDYPPEKLSVYLSDDGGSELMFYAMLEASLFSKHWLPFCKQFKVEPPSPSAFFSGHSDPLHPHMDNHYSSIKKLYKDMENRIKIVIELGRAPEEIRKENKGFLEWDTVYGPRDHQTILQVLIDGRDPNAVDMEGQPLPTLVYMAREKRPQYHHNFKAGAMNSLIRVSSKISNAPIILNVDCDMYSNNLDSVRDALCFFMDDEKGHEIAYVQYPQNFYNIIKNDLYGSFLRTNFEVELYGMDDCGGPLYIGSGCFHRRDILCGRKYTEDYQREWKTENDRIAGESLIELIERIKGLADCSYDDNSQWGKQIGVKYGCPVEDVITGLTIKCRGWKSVYFYPTQKAFLGVAPVTLDQMLVQHKRWSEGHLQIFLSRDCPLWQGHGRINPGLQMAYSYYNLWATYGPPTLYYIVIPSLCLLKGIPLFPKISSPWLLPFAYLTIASSTYSLGEFLWIGGSVQGWWNDKRIWIYRRTTSYLFAIVDTMLKLLGFTETGFVITDKVADDDVMQRYEQEIMEFGTNSPMFSILTTVALLNLFSLFSGLKRLLMGPPGTDDVLETWCLQILVCAFVVAINLPVYQGIFFRKDKGRIPSSLVSTSFVLTLIASMLPMY
ncbi:cellulose synthase-like protein E1 isoform X2 [Telopea speciosissima]|uniref:cellulose synthase-like protein E1 isoform X2 n=1 Tax=Telopea speciosissima TaxID=54955 RepID=UPI001CC6AE5F|nr:cellulose synthase-like protein E1 isoform X2 [Telopea speciosissima]